MMFTLKNLSNWKTRNYNGDHLFKIHSRRLKYVLQCKKLQYQNRRYRYGLYIFWKWKQKSCYYSRIG